MIKFRKAPISNNVGLIGEVHPDMQAFFIINGFDARNILKKSALLGKPFFEDKIVSED